MTFRDNLKEKMLAVLPYCFVKENGEKGSLVKAEFEGDDEQGGAFDFLFDLIKAEIKKGFREGHWKGATSAMESLPEDVQSNYSLDKDLNFHWSNSKWESYEEELE